MVAATDESGKVIWQGSLTAFGEDGGEAGLAGRVASYTGKDFDEESGLTYFNARWYDAELGRFTTEDPARDGVNWYAYCGNDPLGLTDPTGLYSNPAESHGGQSGNSPSAEAGQQGNSGDAPSTDAGYSAPPGAGTPGAPAPEPPPAPPKPDTEPSFRAGPETKPAPPAVVQDEAATLAKYVEEANCGLRVGASLYGIGVKGYIGLHEGVLTVGLKAGLGVGWEASLNLADEANAGEYTAGEMTGGVYAEGNFGIEAPGVAVDLAGAVKTETNGQEMSKEASASISGQAASFVTVDMSVSDKTGKLTTNSSTKAEVSISQMAFYGAGIQYSFSIKGGK